MQALRACELWVVPAEHYGIDFVPITTPTRRAARSDCETLRHHIMRVLKQITDEHPGQFSSRQRERSIVLLDTAIQKNEAIIQRHEAQTTSG
jgi:hypothetical protein